MSSKRMKMNEPPYITPDTTPTAKEAAALSEASLIFGVISQSLSEEFSLDLTPENRDFDNLNPVSLWDELREKYSAVVGTIHVQLLQQIWRGSTQEGEDPSKRMTEIHSAYLQIKSAGKRLSEGSLVAYAMTLNLPESYNALKQNLWL
nr:hypothetical protein L203_01393 [Cryptococcus depauperatus CBS 7841]